MMEEKVIVYTDGACSHNPGPGGWGAFLRFKNVGRYLSGYSNYTTNNKMELSAAIHALKALHKLEVTLLIHTDSTYVKDGMQKWISSWRSRGWRAADKKPVKNRELWEELDHQTHMHHVDWQWVKGHGNSRYNNFVDWLARDAIIHQRGRTDKGPIDEIERFIDRALQGSIT